MSAHFYKKGISFATYSHRQIMWRKCYVIHDEVIVTSSMMTYNYDNYIFVRTQVQTL